MTLQQRLREAGVFPKKGKLTGVVEREDREGDRPLPEALQAAEDAASSTRGCSQRIVGRLVVQPVAVPGPPDPRTARSSSRTRSRAASRPTRRPTGDYEINDKQVDPTWTPPDSPWAAELSSIPPGPGNPLGTRWIGTTAPGIGFHGTYADYSVGTAASHGCMRMHIPDVEAFYEMVTIGMKVSIRP